MKKIGFLILLTTFTLTGCVTGTRNIDLEIPSHNIQKKRSGTVYIETINDNRKFEQSPRTPSIPSVDGKLLSTSKETLSTLIGRQRNGWGAAMGDIALPKGVTVNDKVRELLTAGLESRGYEVVNNSNATYKVSVDIEKFWAWFSPGMWSVSFESNLLCKLDIKQATNSEIISVTGYGINKGQVASDENWKLAYQRAYSDFLTNLDKLLDAKGL